MPRPRGVVSRPKQDARVPFNIVMTANRTDVDILDDFCARSRLPSEAETITLLRSYARNNRRTEDNRVDLKEAHSDSPAGWAQTCKDIVAMHNSGGGVLLFGVKDSGERIGINASLMAHFDPTNVNNKLRRCHISGKSEQVSLKDSTTERRTDSC